jgi:hypothetical protein
MSFWFPVVNVVRSERVIREIDEEPVSRIDEAIAQAARRPRRAGAHSSRVKAVRDRGIWAIPGLRGSSADLRIPARSVWQLWPRDHEIEGSILHRRRRVLRLRRQTRASSLG